MRARPALPCSRYEQDRRRYIRLQVLRPGGRTIHRLSTSSLTGAQPVGTAPPARPGPRNQAWFTATTARLRRYRPEADDHPVPAVLVDPHARDLRFAYIDGAGQVGRPGVDRVPHGVAGVVRPCQSSAYGSSATTVAVTRTLCRACVLQVIRHVVAYVAVAPLSTVDRWMSRPSVDAWHPSVTLTVTASGSALRWPARVANHHGHGKA